MRCLSAEESNQLEAEQALWRAALQRFLAFSKQIMTGSRRPHLVESPQRFSTCIRVCTGLHGDAAQRRWRANTMMAAPCANLP
jgi:hypothetical protein